MGAAVNDVKLRPLAAVAALALLAAIVPTGAMAAYTASIKAGGSARTASQVLTVTNDSSAITCTTTPDGGLTVSSASSFDCPTGLFPSALPPTNGTIVTEGRTFSPTGSVGATASTLAALSCGPVVIANAKTASNPMLPRFGVGFGAAGPTRWPGSSALTFDGTGMATDVTSRVVGNTFSLAIWFKTSVSGGGLMSFSSKSNADTATAFDKMLFIDSAGHLNFGYWPGLNSKVTSPAVVSDGAWHFAIGVIKAGGSQSTQTLYLDGVSVGTPQTFSNNSGSNYSGWWRLGRAEASNGWGGNGDFFVGSLAGAATWPVAVTATNADLMYNQVFSQSVYGQAVDVSGGDQSWLLGDTGQATSLASYQVNGSGDPCARVGVQIKSGAICVYPAPSCGSYPTLNALVAAGTFTTPTPALAASARLATSIQQNGTQVAYDRGLQLAVPLRMVQTGGFSRTFLWPNNRLTM
jgi:hypothetical protein